MYNFYYLSIIVLLFVSCNNNNIATSNSKIDTFPVLKLELSNVNVYQDYPGTVQGIENVEIRPKIDGFVKKIYVDEGATVHKNQLLFLIDAPQYEQLVRTAKADIKIAQADVDAARMAVKKVQPMVKKDVISHYELEGANFTLESKKAVLSQAVANYENAKINMSYTKIYSPVNGVIGLIPFKIGSLINSATVTPLTTVSNNSSIYVYFSFNEKQELDFFSSTKGKTVQEKLKTLPPVSLVLPNGIVFDRKGIIFTESGLVNTQTGAVNLRATFPNPEGLIRSGNSALIRIPQLQKPSILIPQKAVYQIQNKLFVYKLESGNKVNSVAITVASTTDGENYIVLDGLHMSDKIVIDGIDNLHEGQQIASQMTTLKNANGHF